MKATSHKDITCLAFGLASVKEEDRWKIVATVHMLGLMKFKSRTFRFFLWLIRRVRGKQGVFNFFAQLQQRSPETVTDFLEQTIMHIMNGIDIEDPDSVGGLSQRELDLLLLAINYKPVEE